MITLEAKKRLIHFLTKSVSFKSRESYWVLNYLLNHDVILNKVIFVEQANKTPRGLVLSEMNQDLPGMVLYKKNHRFDHPEQIFHDIRNHWRDELYLEIMFSNQTIPIVYQEVLEDNPFIGAFDSISPQVFEELELFFVEEAKEYELACLQEEINDALEQGEIEQFKALSKKYKELNHNFLETQL